MPIGIQRLNTKKSHPNDRIVFIKPLKGPDEKIAQDFLERIAAQCLPVMKEHHLSVMSLEEYEWNPEFVGRNFNAGEVIQLVLKARSGHWLPFEYVQMVMMHELAHCKQMNHARAFWAVRNAYAEQMRALWSRGYTGEGLWGRGVLLTTGEFTQNTAQPSELPEHLCGGTYRSRRNRKRKIKTEEQLTYQEKKERRILKKFGPGGVALGEDARAKRMLEGKRVAAKPRVAGSARGRELRAAAALARFSSQQPKEEGKKQEEAGVENEKRGVKEEEEIETASEASDDEYEEIKGEDEVDDAVDVNGKRLLDNKGRGMVRVCGGDENIDDDDQDARDELRELQSSFGAAGSQRITRAAASPEPTTLSSIVTAARVKREESPDSSIGKVPERKKPRHQIGQKGEARRREETERRRPEPSTKQPPKKTQTETTAKDPPSIIKREQEQEQEEAPPQPQPQPARKAAEESGGQRVCETCSFANDRLTTTCIVCSNVVVPNLPGAWSCQSSACKGSRYRNAGDCGVCGVCGGRKA